MGIYKKEEAQMSLDFSERRRYERVHLELPVTGQCLGVAGDIYPFQGETRDLSFEGFLMIKSTNVIQLHDLLMLTSTFFYIIEQKLTGPRKKMVLPFLLNI